MSVAHFQALINEMTPEGGWQVAALKAMPSIEAYLGDSNYQHYFAAPTVEYSGNLTNDVCLRILHPILGTLFSARLKRVEVCCAMMFLHTFAAKDTPAFPKENFKKIVDNFFGMVSHDTYFSSRRVMVNMVEAGRGAYDPLKVPEERERLSTRMNHSRLYDYFMENAAKVNVMRMPNANSGNIIHHMEVLFDKNYFNKV